MPHQINRTSAIAPIRSDADRAAVARINNFLTLCLTHAEVALELETREEMGAALRQILGGAREITAWMQAERKDRALVASPLAEELAND